MSASSALGESLQKSRAQVDRMCAVPRAPVEGRAVMGAKAEAAPTRAAARTERYMVGETNAERWQGCFCGIKRRQKENQVLPPDGNGNVCFLIVRVHRVRALKPLAEEEREVCGLGGAKREARFSLFAQTEGGGGLDG